MIREEPCLLCGGTIVASGDPSEAVLAHVRTDRHRMARGRQTHRCGGCRMVTIPAHRERCHGCSRSRAAA